MLGSIYIGLSGLDAYSRGLKEISNNVTNMNTSGFKASTVTFQNFYGTEDTGGLSHTVNSQNGGGGVGIGGEALNMKAGELRQTDRDLDLAIDGTGFLVLLKGDEVLYARTGSFDVDKDGFVVLSGTEYRLATLDANNRPVSLTIDNRRSHAPQQTSALKFSDYLTTSSNSPVAVSNIKVFDLVGGEHVWTVTFTKDSTASTQTVDAWKVKVTEGDTNIIGEGAVKFDKLGKLDPSTTSFTVASGSQLSVVLDFTGLQSVPAASPTPTVKPQDGYAAGALSTIAVNSKGELELSYTNEQKAVLGAVALADFRDTGGLRQKGGGLFAYEGSGEAILAGSSDPRVGQVMSKRIEASNVDLSAQFGDLILIQRGFQASSQVISISNDMIQQLFGIRGQG